MIIKHAHFITSFSDYQAYLAADLPDAAEICVIGRSNVGKSSFINMLAMMRKLAKTSSMPGRTRLINIFGFNENEFLLVDLPGYGYAKAGKQEKEKWGVLIEGYLKHASRLKQVILLVDSRHLPSEKDKQMLEYLYFYQLPFTIVATKADKLSKAELARNIQKIATELKVGRDNIIAVSSETRMGREQVLKRIEEILQPDISVCDAAE